MRTNLKRRFLLVLVLIFSLLFAVISGEIALRLFGFEFALYPTKVQFGWPDPVTLKNLYHFDKELLWVPKDYSTRVAAWKGKRPTVVFMGDSNTEFGRYDEFLKSIIYEQNPNSAFTFVNMGVAGWSSYQGLQQLQRDVLPMLPRFVTIYYGWNDHWTSFGIEDKNMGEYNLEYSTLQLEVFSNVRVVQLLNKAIFILKRNVTEQDERDPERVSLADFKSNLLQMVQIARDNDIIPLLLTAPSSHKKGQEPEYLAERWLNDLNELVPIHKKYVQAVRDISAKEDVLLIDLHAEFDRLPQEDIIKFFQKDGIHLTEQGNRKIAELMYNYFVRNDLQNRLDGNGKTHSQISL